MEAVENLMVGEYADFCVVVHESFVERAVDGREGDILLAVGEDCLKAFELLGIVRENVYCVAFGDETAEILAYDIEILVVYSLRRAVEVECRTLAAGCLGGIIVNGGCIAEN